MCTEVISVQDLNTLNNLFRRAEETFVYEVLNVLVQYREKRFIKHGATQYEGD